MERYCRNCGQRLRENANFCPKCGRAVERTGENDDKEYENHESPKYNEKEISFTKNLFVAFLCLCVFLIVLFGGRALILKLSHPSNEGNKTTLEDWLSGLGSSEKKNERYREEYYQNILDEYQEAARNDFSEYELTNARYINEGVWNFSNAEEYFVYYWLKDLSRDGIPELMISVSTEEEEKNIVDIYTVEDEKAVRVIPSNGSVGYRSLFWVCEDNRIKQFLAGGVNHEECIYFRLEKNSTFLTEEERFIYDSDSEPEYTHEDSGGNISEITWGEFLWASHDYDVNTEDEWVLLYSVSHG